MTVTPSRAEDEGTTARRGHRRRPGSGPGPAAGTADETGAETGTRAGTRAGTAVETGPGAEERGTAAGMAKRGGTGAGTEGKDNVQLPGARVATADTAPGGTEGAPAEVTPPTRGFLAKATLVTAVLSIAGALLGLGRDQALAHLFGAGTETDAFLVAWTVPEVAATLLIEDGMAFVLVPAFSLAVARRARGTGGDPVRALVASTLPRITLVLVGVSALLIAGAPYLVAGLAPGLPDPGLAVDCTRLTATCVLSFGLAGYCSAALRAHRRFLAPAAIYVAYNTGIITAMFVLGGHWGVRSAAIGVALGGCLMVAAQLPALVRQLFGRHRSETTTSTATATASTATPAAALAKAPEVTGAGTESPVAGQPGERSGTHPVTHSVNLALVTPVLLFALCRQSQVLIERYLASNLPSGAISHLNYAQKVAQIPMTLSLMLCTVTFPVLAQALAEGDTERARHRVEHDVSVAACIVLLGAAAVFACAPQIIELLFQRGAFTARDTAATATVMRVYSVGLLGHTLVGALVRTYFSAGRPTWYPLAAMAAGIVATSWIGAATVGAWGVSGIAAANAVGITLTAALLLSGMNERRSVPIRTRRVVHELSKPLRAAVCAAVAGALVAGRFDSSAPALFTGGLTVTLVYVLLLRLLGVQAVAPAFRTALRSVTRRLPHARCR
ncbi:murein biosynthesis protein MurJ [Streptomyces sp. LRE541]|uniref:murein biosynthesis integral membrane protein MurJ n=1 Tax=Streptomyces sp. LRE541 TaxID=2931983 RepID=UPI00200FBA96|nr:lipid II flippase MurJ [Streptomyces sp. LRE541]UPZ31140.1 murein biosynthesis protein MurJ [Streptomyces sp. LRE541]